MDYYARRQEIANALTQTFEGAGNKLSECHYEKLVFYVVAKFGCSEKCARQLIEANIKSGKVELVK